MSEQQELNAAVDEFATAMKARLESKRKQGWEGWDAMGRECLADRLLINGDKKSLVDVANLAMMIHRSSTK